METNQRKRGISDNRDRVRSPEELDAYIRVVRPGTLVLVIALVLIVGSLIVWGFTGTLPVTKTFDGVTFSIQMRRDNSLYYYGRDYYEGVLDDVPEEVLQRYDMYFFLNGYEYTYEDIIGKDVLVSRPGKPTVHGTIAMVSAGPYHRNEILAEFDSAWIVNEMVPSDYAWMAVAQLDSDEYNERLISADVTVVMENVHPIDLLLR